MFRPSMRSVGRSTATPMVLCRIAPLPRSVTSFRLQVYSRRYSSSASTIPSSSSASCSSTRRRINYILGSGVVLLALGFTLGKTDPSTHSPSLAQISTPTLLRSYLVWTLTSVPILVDNSPALLQTLFHSRIPGVKAVSEWVVRHTFFEQFIPGETATECLDVLESMRRRNVGHALNYSAEADTREEGELGVDPAVKRFEEVERALEAQGEFERRMEREGWKKGSSAFALKTTGLIDPQVLVRASNAMHRLQAAYTPTSASEHLADRVNFPGCPKLVSGVILSPEKGAEVLIPSDGVVQKMRVFENDPGLSKGDLAELSLLWDRLDSLVARSKRNGIRFIIDAEEAVYQPALDGYTQLLSMKYNKPPSGSNKADWTGPVVYGTYQSYLTRQPSFLKACIAHAEENGYALGLKVVRGGYIVLERRTARLPGREGEDPVWPTKEATDESYNGSVSTILATMKRQLESDHPEQSLSVIFGTHNKESVDTVISELQANGLARKTSNGRLKLNDEVQGKVGIAQLYGMRDDLSEIVTESFEPSRLPMSLKFVAYGRLLEVMPFLGRRAVENKSIMNGPGGAAAERRRVGIELRRRIFG